MQAALNRHQKGRGEAVIIKFCIEPEEFLQITQ